jgi:hypothetical protein
MFPVRYELDFYIPEDSILHSHRRENLKSYLLPLVAFPLYDIPHHEHCSYMVQLMSLKSLMLYCCLSVGRWRANDGGDGCAFCVNDTYDRWQHSFSRAV